MITLKVNIDPKDISREDLDFIAQERYYEIVNILSDESIEEEYMHRGLAGNYNDDITTFSDEELLDEIERRKIEDPHDDLIQFLYWDYIEKSPELFQKALEQFFWKVLQEKKYGQ